MKVKISSIFPVLLLSACVVLVVSCNDKQQPDVAPDISVVANISDGDNLNKFDYTKAARTTEFLTDDSFGLFIVPFQNSVTNIHTPLRPTGNYRDNVKFAHDGSAFALVDAKNAKYPNNSTKVDLYAISPYHLGDNNLKSITQYEASVLANQATAENVIQSDLLTAYELSKAPNSTPATLLFKHRLSRLFVNVIRPVSYKNSATISVNVTAIRGTKIKALVNLFPSLPNDKTDVIVDPNAPLTAVVPFPYSSDNQIHSYEAILVPQTTANLKIDFTLTTTGDVNHEFTYTHSADFSFESGKNHTINLQIEDENIFLAGPPVISPWTTITLPPSNTTEMAANESFTLTANTDLTGVANVKVYCVLDTYVIKANYTASTGLATFKFNGIQNQAPNSYPYTVTKIELLNAANDVLQSITPVPVIIERRTATTINLN